MILLYSIPYTPLQIFYLLPNEASRGLFLFNKYVIYTQGHEHTKDTL